MSETLKVLLGALSDRWVLGSLVFLALILIVRPKNFRLRYKTREREVVLEALEKGAASKVGPLPPPRRKAALLEVIDNREVVDLEQPRSPQQLQDKSPEAPPS